MSSLTPDSSHEMQALQPRVGAFGGEVRQEVAGASPDVATPPVSAELLEFAKKAAVELGFEIIGLELVTDPDDEQSIFYSLDVQGRGTPQELFERRMRWHEQLCRFDSSYIGHLSMSLFPIS
jgi:hypothetical protein